MADIYVFDPKCEDFTTFGLVGALMPTSCVFEEELNGMSEITLDHPIDDLGRYKALEINNLLVAPVPVRTTPELPDDDSTGFVTNVWVCKVQSATAAYRALYKTRTGSTKIKVLPSGTQVTVVKKYDEGRWKVKSKYGTGWVHQDALGEETAVEIEDKSQGIEAVEPAWVVKPQVFRIYEVRKDIASVSVAARHITYDLLYQTTNYKATSAKTCKEALAGIFDNLIGATLIEGDLSANNVGVTAYTNLANSYTGIEWERINPINAMLDPETGLTTLYKATLVRDNWDMYFLKDPGMYRGVTIEYAKNMTGIDYVESTDEIATRIIPVGETADGEPLPYKPIYPDGTEVLPSVNYIDSPKTVIVDGVETSIVSAYPIPYTMVLECQNCKVGSGGITTAVQAYARMREQTAELFAADVDLPKIEMSVDFINLGDTEEYKQFKDMERLFLSDLVRVRHPDHGIDITAKVCFIKWDCLLERMERIDVGSSIKTLAQIPGYTSTGGGFIVSGSVLEGALILNSDPVEPMEAATKQYVDNGLKTAEVNTDAELKAIQDAANAYIAEELAKRGQLKPEYANSIAECTDTSKLYVLPDGYIYAYMYSLTGVPEIIITGESGGYYVGDEWNPTGKLQANSSCSAKRTDLIPVTPGDVLNYKGYGADAVYSVFWLNSSQALLNREQINSPGTFTSVTAPENAAYVWFGSFQYTTSTSGVVLDVEWVTCQASTKEYNWTNTGHAFVPADYEDRIIALEEKTANLTATVGDVLKDKKIVYDGDSICMGYNADGGYPALIAEITGGSYDNQGVGGGLLTASSTVHSVVNNLANLPTDGDIYCLQGGINDYWANTALGTFNQSDYTGTLDTSTICGALETIFRYALSNFVGKAICFIITHKIQNTAYQANGAGHTFNDYRNAMIAICEKYSIPYYDAFAESGLNGWDETQSNAYLTGNSAGTADGIHPNVEGYKRYYVPQLLDIFRAIVAGGASGVSGGTVSSSVSWNDLTDKPFGEIDEVGIILPETTFTIDADAGLAYITEAPSATPVVGNTYTVNWNGTEYECIAQTYDDGTMVGAALGDYGALTGGESTGEPFVIILLNMDTGGLWGLVASFDGTTTPTASVTGRVQTVKKLDEKFLPEDIKPAFFAKVKPTDNGMYLIDGIAFSDIYAATMQGRTVYLQYEDTGEIWATLVNVNNSHAGFISSYTDGTTGWITIYNVYTDGSVKQYNIK